MLAQISSIPTTVREGFEAQNLPHRASTVNEGSLRAIFGGAHCIPKGGRCGFGQWCCSLRCAVFLRCL